VNWYDAVLFCNWSSRKCGLKPCYSRTGKKERVGNRDYNAWGLDPTANGYRLPTDAEWEYACRTGTTTEFVCGDDETNLGRYATYIVNSNSRTSEVGSKLCNGWGLFDMHGNVYEWCYDWYIPRQRIAPKGTGRSCRGGAWAYLTFSFSPRGRLSSFRHHSLGLRLAATSFSQ
jgi:formylglycine-generating enzyme required for sulfatase activity